MKIMGLDIGGANTDSVIVELKSCKSNIIKSDKYYLPMWVDPEQLSLYLDKLNNSYSDVDVVCVSMTAELADCYTTKKEGVLDITNRVMESFYGKTIKFITFDGLKDYEYIKENPLSAAAANWIGTVNILKYIKKSCIFMDMGTTTTDIIPIRNGKQVCVGNSDLNRLSNGELVYTGLLRTNLATIVDSVPVDDKKVLVSSELFSITADMQMVLGNITSEKYTCSTPDGKVKSIDACLNRIAHLVCSDLDELTTDQIIFIAQYIYDKQVAQITNNLKRVHDRTNLDTVIISENSNSAICMKATENLNLDSIKLDDYISSDISSIITSLGNVQMYIDEYVDENVQLIDF